MTKPTEGATEGSPDGPATTGVFTSQGTEYSVSGTKTFTISSTSTLTNFITVYPAGSSGAPGGGYGSGGSPTGSAPAGSAPAVSEAGAGETCAPNTVTVTEKEVVTVTVGGDDSGSATGYPTGGSGSATSVGPIQSSSAPYYPTGSYPASSGVAGSSGFLTKTKPAQPSGTGSSDCWGMCFSQNGISSKDALCGNDAVTGCIADSCGAESSAAYGKWLEEYCAAPSTSSGPAAPVTTSSAPAYETSSSPAAPVTTSSKPAGPPPAYETSSSPAAPVETSSAPAPPPAYETPAPEPSTPAEPVPTTSEAPAPPPAYETPAESTPVEATTPAESAPPAYTAPPAYSFAPEASSAAPAAPPAYTKA